MIRCRVAKRLRRQLCAGYGWFKEIKPSQESPAPAASIAAPSVVSNAQAGDYTEVSFNNAVLNRLDRPQDYELLKREIEVLKKPANSPWVTRLKQALATKDSKFARKRLRDKDWFPKDWLPTP